MKRRRLTAGMVTAVVLIALDQATVPAAPQAPSAEGAVLNLVQTWLTAESEGDTAALDRLIAGDFIGTGPGGNILEKRDIVPPEGQERPRMPKSSVKESTVRQFGNTAVVMGSVAFENPDKPGFRFTLVFMNRGQGWQIVAAHLANSQPAK